MKQVNKLFKRILLSVFATCVFVLTVEAQNGATLEGTWKIELDNAGTTVTLKVRKDNSICSNCYGRYAYHSERNNEYSSGVVIQENGKYVFGEASGPILDDKFRGNIDYNGVLRINTGYGMMKFNKSYK